ncbi:MAG TPA: helix-turn-helix transcriptional regulator [Pseudobdellovibrionaceae bacterium]|nr:helix-turn-helix transcriptional regulator [Pseudobdellovibrionaceae bacterium]
MPARSPHISKKTEKMLRQLGQQLREHRKTFGLSAVTTAEAAGLSRITLHRIERGEPSVAMGAYLGVAEALGLQMELVDPKHPKKPRSQARPKLPRKIRLADFEQLKKVAWQLKKTEELTPSEALNLYERNWRHLDLKSMDAREKKLLESLLAAFGRERPLV